MAEISQFKLAELFGDSSALYEKLVRRKGYLRRTQVEFDVDLAETPWISMGCGLLIVMVHQRKEAFIVMLSSEDVAAMRESLAEMQVSLNANEIERAGRPVDLGTELVKASRGFGF